jgi:uncharacterized membrane protein
MGEPEEAEIFSDRSSLYIASDSLPKARYAAERFREKGLFTGSWEDPSESPAALPVDAAPPQARSAGGGRALSAVLGLLCLGLAVTAVAIWNDRQSLVVERDRTAGTLREDAKKMSTDLAELQAARDKLQHDLETSQTQYENREVLAAETIAHIYDSLPAAGRSVQVEMVNACSDTVFLAAITFPGAEGVWVTRGWFRLKYGETTQIGQYPSGSSIYLYAKNESGASWDAASIQDGKEIDVVDNPFVHMENQPIFGKNQKRVKAFRKEFPAFGKLVHTFECAKTGSTGAVGKHGPA